MYHPLSPPPSAPLARGMMSSLVTTIRAVIQKTLSAGALATSVEWVSASYRSIDLLSVHFARARIDQSCTNNSEPVGCW